MRVNERGGFEIDLLISLILLVVIVGALGGFSAIMSMIKCNNQWADSGYNAEYRFFSGCMVQRKDGTWLPADKLRDINL